MKKQKYRQIVSVILSLLLVSSGAILTKTQGAEANLPRLFFEDFEGYSSDNDAAMQWNKDADAGQLSYEKTYLYKTSSEGENRLETAESFENARFSVITEVGQWSAESGTFTAVEVRSSSDGSYRMSLYPTDGIIKLEKVTESGIEVLDETIYDVTQKTIYALAMSAKDGFINCEIDGVVWLSKWEDEAPLGAGCAAIVTNLQEAEFRSPLITGENRIIRLDFESGREFSDGLIPVKYSSGTIENGYLKLTDKGSQATLNINNLKFKDDESWRNIKIDMGAAFKRGTNIYVRNGVISGDWDAYTAVVKKQTSGSYITTNKTFGTKYATSLISRDLGDSEFRITASTNADLQATDTQLDYTIDGESFMSGSCPGKRTGGISIAVDGGGEVWLSDISITDLSSETTTADILFDGGFEQWNETGSVQGESDVEIGGKVMRCEQTQSGVITLPDRKWTNMDFSADVKLGAGEIGSYAGLYFRYTDDANYMMLGLDNDKIFLTETVDGVQSNIASTAYSFEKDLLYRIEIQAKDGIYRSYVDGALVLQAQNSIEEKKTVGTIGVGGSNREVEFDNIEVKGENRYIFSDGLTPGATVSITARQTQNLSHTKLNALVYFETFDKTNVFHLESRRNSSKAYAAHIRAAGGTIVYDLMTPDWKIKFQSDKNLSSYMTAGEYNLISLETETLENGNVAVRMYANGQLAGEYIDSSEKYLPENGYNTYYVLGEYNAGYPVDIKTVWLEDCRIDNSMQAKICLSHNELTVGSCVNSTVTADNRTYEGKKLYLATALYSKTGRLINVQLAPFTAASGGLSEVSIETDIPVKAEGGRLKSMCINSLLDLEEICDSAQLR